MTQAYTLLSLYILGYLLKWTIEFIWLLYSNYHQTKNVNGRMSIG